MQDLVVNFLNEVNPMQLIAIGIIVWFFYGRLDKKIANLSADMNHRFEKVDERCDKMEDKFDKKFAKMEERFDKMEKRFDKKFSEMEEKFEDKLGQLGCRVEKLEWKVESIDRTLCRMEGSLLLAPLR
jgi:uncharacterized membrane-anchored protein YhcB (DUF1043 family)